jgi:predicted ATPase with chaperone activity
MPPESLEELTTSLKSAQYRAKSLSANFARLMRLVLDEEIEGVERDIADVKAGRYNALKVTEADATKEWEVRKRIAKARLTAAEREIDIRFAASVDAEWQKYKVSKHCPILSFRLEFYPSFIRRLLG